MKINTDFSVIIIIDQSCAQTPPTIILDKGLRQRIYIIILIIFKHLICTTHLTLLRNHSPDEERYHYSIRVLDRTSEKSSCMPCFVNLGATSDASNFDRTPSY